MSQRRPIIVDEDEPAIDVAEAAFEVRHGDIRKDKWFTDEFKVIDFLGRGKFGEVKRCVETSTGTEFAAKFICTPRPQERKDVEHEVSMMRKLRHRRLVQLYDAFEAKKEMCLVLEIIYGGELFDRVVSDDFLLTEKACVCLVRQICEGVEFMHSKNIIHLDLKPENILCLTKSGNRIKIIDFGLAREFNPKVDTRVMFGTPEFMAPEVVQYDPIDFSTDIWSIGVICYVLLSGLSPFMGDTDVETLSNVSKGKYDFAYSEFDKVSSDAKDFISRLLVTDKKKRITARQCLDHVWLSKAAINSSSEKIKKTQLKHFLSRRKWQKAINVIIALRRMGWNMKTRQNSAVNCRPTDSHDRSNKGWSTTNKSTRPEMTLKGAFKNCVEPQVRTKGANSKAKSAESDSAIVKTKVQINASQSSKTDPVLPSTSTNIVANNAIASTNSADSPIATSNLTTTTSDHKKCRKVVEHTSPGNSHVFNLAKVVAHKPRSVRNEFRPSLEDGEYSSNCERNNSDVRKDLNSCVDGSIGLVDGVVDGRNPAAADSGTATIKQPKQQNNNGERPRRKDLMIREKIRFFNQIEEKPVHTGKTHFLFKDRQSEI